ncbi:MAG TPA: MBL fold metallo-hydrolase [Prolixibacteraceae bacterium]|jgi:L-ascorbate metabolism protein UlaG (beta-lactamase superfamily)
MKTFFSLFIILFISATVNAQSVPPVKAFEKDTFKTSKGNLVITFIGHASVMIEAGNRVIFSDPCSTVADYSFFPKADIILVSHEHVDHLDKKAISLLAKAETKTIVSRVCKGMVDNSLVMINGDTQTFGDFKIEAVPAYNIVNTNADGVAYHIKGDGNGYVINYGGKRIYIGGDTEHIPEMSKLKKIDIAFLPVGLPYNMTYKMTADAARSFMPAILYPYHFDEKEPRVLNDLLKDTSIKIRVRRMK